jgi:enoyl-CoA hydratase/carnithine racemase
MTTTFRGRALSWEPVDGVLEVRLHREPANEIGLQTLEELEHLVRAIGDGAHGCRALVWHSDRPAGFCAGADLRALHEGLIERSERAARAVDRVASVLPTGARDLLDRGARRVARPLVKRRVGAFIDRIHAAFDALDQAPLPTVAAVHGVCLGGGLELALTADVIVADKTARFGFPELRLGLIPGFGGLPRLARDVGNAVSRDLLLTGRTIRATRAYELGLVSQVVAPDQALAVARGVARQMTRFDPHVTAKAKAFAKPLPRAALDREKELFLQMVGDPVVIDALTRFVEDDGPMPWLPRGDPDAR